MHKKETQNISEILSNYVHKKSDYWLNIQKKHALEIFKRACAEIPAYKSFLHQENINTKKITTYEDYKNLPIINKKNYFRLYPLKELINKKQFSKIGLIMTATSGSTGQPTYFSRNEKIDWNYSVLAEFFLNNGPEGPTLLINCFGMGVWIGGLITYQAFRYTALRGKAVTIITPGINKKEIFHALKELAPNFKNVILAGYPPFIKDLLDECKEEKINFKLFKTRLLFAAESFTEEFRNYVCQKAQIKNHLLDTLNLYGSAELGAMAFETPTSILIRRLSLKNPKIFQTLFPRGGQPTLAQYNPQFVMFIKREDKLLISAEAPSPFINYDMGDTGDIYSINTIKSIFKEHGLNLEKEAKKQKIRLLNLPFVYVHIRSDFAVKLYGAIIHPEPITEAIQGPEFKKLLTQKFAMEIKSDQLNNQYLQINVELKNKIRANKFLENKIKHKIINILLEKNAEYKNNYQSIPKKVTPIIKLWDHGSPEYFQSGIKQKWIIK